MSDSEKEKQTDNQTPAGVGHNSQHATKAGQVPVQKLPIGSVMIWAPAAEQAADATPETLENEIEVLAACGQRVSVPGRTLPDGTIEVVAKAHLVDAVRMFNERNPSRRLDLEVRVFANLSDEFAYRALAQDVEPGHEPSSLARGQLFIRAVEKFGSVERAAAGCRVSKASVSKNLDVARCISVVGHRIQDVRNINQRDATWLMSIVGRQKNASDSLDKAVRQTMLAMIEKLEPASAKKIFNILRTTTKPVDDKPVRNRIPLMVGDQHFGYIRLIKRRLAEIKFADVGDIAPDAIADAIRRAIESYRNTLNR